MADPVPAPAPGAEAAPAAAPPSTPARKKFSELLRSSLENSTKKPGKESPTESDAKQPLKAKVMLKIDETEATLLKRLKLQVPRRFEERATFDWLWKNGARDVKKAVNYCKAWAAKPSQSPGPILMGKSGTFKTHLLWATAREIHARAEERVKSEAAARRIKLGHEIEQESRSVSFSFNPLIPKWPIMDLVATDGAEIAHEVRGTVERKNLDEVIARYRHQGEDPKEAVLLIDDVEVMKLSDWLHEELYRIFDYRYQESMPLMVATNLTADELRRHLGDRIARRILDMTEPFQL